MSIDEYLDYLEFLVYTFIYTIFLYIVKMIKSIV